MLKFKFKSKLKSKLKSLPVIILSSLSLISGLPQYALASNNINLNLIKSTPITAYLLMSSPNSIQTLENIANTTQPIPYNRLDLSFIKPHLNTWQPASGVQELVQAGLISSEEASKYPQLDLSDLIQKIKNKGIQVTVSVGGWANSECTNATSQCPAGEDNFPLGAQVNQYASSIPINPAVQVPVSANEFNQDIQQWVNFAEYYGFNGIDLDDEESWYATEYAVVNPEKTHSKIQYGQLYMPQAVEKYGLILKTLEQAIFRANQKNIQNPMFLTVAAPSVAAFNIHDYSAVYINGVKTVRGNLYWKPASSNIPLKKITGGNLKGIYYDIVHMNNHPASEDQDFAVYDNGQGLFSDFGYLFDAPSDPKLKQLQLSGVNTVGIMSYDLDDGYQTPANGYGSGVSSVWCIGSLLASTTPNGPLSSYVIVRDPVDPGQGQTTAVSCSIESQGKTLVSMFNKLLKNEAYEPSIQYGIEAGFPNYPINLDASLPGGGYQTQNTHYRWNDPWVEYDIPMISTNGLPNYQQSENIKNIHSTHLLVNQNLFETMKSAGATGVMVWSINNQAFNQYMSISNPNGDYQKYAASQNPNNTQYFGQDYLRFSQNTPNTPWQPILNIFKDAATPLEILNQACSFYNNCTH